jgi:hypothetical protein
MVKEIEVKCDCAAVDLIQGRRFQFLRNLEVKLFLIFRYSEFSLYFG